MEPYLCVLLVLLLPLHTHQQAAVGCPPDFLPLLRSCYKMLPGAYRGVDAVSQCEIIGANITSSKTEAENNLLLELRSNASRGGQRLWLGMTDSASPNEWRWTDDNSLVDAYPTSHHWRTTTKSEALPANNLQCAWILSDSKGRLWSHTKCNNHEAITVCKIYLDENPESTTDKTTSMNNELSSAQNMVATALSTDSAHTETASSSDQYGRLSSGVRTPSPLLSTITDTTTLSVEEEDISSDTTTAYLSLMTPSATETMQSNLSATAATTSMALATPSAPGVIADTSTPSQPALLGTENSTVSVLTHPTTSTQIFMLTPLQTHIETTDSYESHLSIQPSFTEIVSTETTKQISPYVSAKTSLHSNTASGFTLTSQFLYPSTVHNVISHTPSNNCLCPCKTKLLPEVLSSLQEKYSALILKRSALSSYVRKKVSIADFRVSSNFIGVSGLLVCLVPLFLVFASDLLTCVKGK
ncbi:serine-rich adhesin for platelets-like [Haliotis rubra]|uniref:serine-rich adhesin for platelets-like n=1 Tax=Haliotis rubra TaxID=36100 RepID=UPI001EE56ECE|nr:serine-rich adhesin for platelets-like [Haliotis rubra]